MKIAMFQQRKYCFISLPTVCSKYCSFIIIYEDQGKKINKQVMNR